MPVAEIVENFEVPADFKSSLLSSSAPESVKRLLAYVHSIATEETLKILRPFEERKLKSRMHLTPVVLRHLEIFANQRGEAEGSLYLALDRTKTPAGARRFREYLQFPLVDEGEISKRLEAVEAWRNEVPKLKKLREILGPMGDLERRLTKVSFPQANARDLLSLAQGLQTCLQALSLDRFSELTAKENESLLGLCQEIQSTIVEEPPLSTKQGGLINKGISSLLDEYIELTTESHRLLQEMEAKEKEATGIPSLKIRYNNVFGYYIEVTNTHKDKVPSRYQRKQTLSTAERYITEELIELERKVITAQTKRFELEFEIFESLKKKSLSLASTILKAARRCSYLDVESSLAWLSLEQNYVRPQFNSQGTLKIESSRHPVVEQSLKGSFVPNTISLDKEGCLLLTGPNMAGKSTLMRQVALSVLMAQMGSFVPASRAELPIFDQIFTRVGASDFLTEGLSTFMVEMTETAEMLKQATSQSLLILDEVGRGTSTFDGMALAQAILEHILKKIKCLTFFATHYHELTAMEAEFPVIKNAHMSIVERNGKIEFLHTLKEGPAKKSYGIHVAELAGLPMSVITRAQTLLKSLEAPGSSQKQMSLLDFSQEISEMDDTAEVRHLKRLAEQLKKFPLSEKTPLDALNQIALWQKSCHEVS
jgi:DNA mismatch repair protein MutS